MFYIIPKNYNMSRAAVHIGFHDHPVADGDCREALELIWNQIFAQVAKMPNAKNSAIGLAVGKELLLKGLIDESCNGSCRKVNWSKFLTSGVSLVPTRSGTSSLKLEGSAGKVDTSTTFLSSKNPQHTTTSMIACFQGRALTLSIFLRCQHVVQLAESVLFDECSQVEI
jgi:hypothetical protein